METGLHFRARSLSLCAPRETHLLEKCAGTGMRNRYLSGRYSEESQYLILKNTVSEILYIDKKSPIGKNDLFKTSKQILLLRIYTINKS